MACIKHMFFIWHIYMFLCFKVSNLCKGYTGQSHWKTASRVKDKHFTKTSINSLSINECVQKHCSRLLFFMHLIKT